MTRSILISLTCVSLAVAPFMIACDKTGADAQASANEAQNKANTEVATLPMICAVPVFPATQTWLSGKPPNAPAAVPWALRPAVAAVVVAVLLALVAWFAAELRSEERRVGKECRL